MAKITEYPEAQSFDAGDVILKDGSGGTKKMTVETLKTLIAPDVDATLTQEGQAADAKKVGGEVTDLKSAITNLTTDVEGCLPYNSKTPTGTTIVETQVAFETVGQLDLRYGTVMPTETVYKVSDYIDITDITGIYRTGTETKFTLWGYSFYDANKTFLSSVADTTNYDIVDFNNKRVTWLNLNAAPEGAKYLRTSWQTSRPYTYYTVTQTYSGYEYDTPSITIDGISPLIFKGKKIVNFGDSIFGNFRDTNETTDKSISKMIADATGATVYNAGFGGCRMATHSAPWWAFSMFALADSIATGNWSTQSEAITESMPSYFAETVTMLAGLDFSQIDYITIGYGANDYTGNVFIKSTDGTFAYEYDYFEGALRYSIRRILNAYPNIKIIVITPCWMWFPDANGAYSYDSDDAQSKNTRNYKLPDYVDACIKVCEEYHVPYIDTYYTLGFNPYSYTAYFPVKGVDGYTVSDGTHPKQNGRQLRADRIIGQLEALY